MFASSSTSTAPAAAIQQQQSVRILRRPNDSASSLTTQSSSSETASKGYDSLKDRQAAYDVARARIFGTCDSPKDSLSSPRAIAGQSGQPVMRKSERPREPSRSQSSGKEVVPDSRTVRVFYAIRRRKFGCLHFCLSRRRTRCLSKRTSSFIRVKMIVCLLNRRTPLFLQSFASLEDRRRRFRSVP